MKKKSNQPSSIHKVSRRSLIKASAAIGAASALPRPLGFGADRAMAATPKKGGTLRVGISDGATSDTLDPAVVESRFTIATTYSSFSHLTETDHNGALAPEIATSWEPSANATKWAFEIRKGVEFHNGKTLTADDVIASINYHRGDASTSAAKPLLEPLTELKSDGPNRVLMTIEAPNVDWPAIISDYHVMMRPSTNGKIDPQDNTGTGPYKVTRFEPGVGATLTKHGNYFKSDRAHFDKIELLSVTTASSKTAAFLSGELDAVDEVDIATVDKLEQVPNIAVKSVPGSLHYTFPMRTDTPPFNDNNIRLALKEAFPREEFVKKVLRGYGLPGNDNPISPAYQFFDETLEQRKYDPDRAKYHLKQAGLSSLNVDLSVSEGAFGGAVNGGELYKEFAKAANIDINLIREPADGYWSNVWLTKPWCACAWVGPVSENWIFTSAYSAGAPWNDTYWEHERFNSLLVQARSETDTSKRGEMYAEMQRILRDEGGVTVASYNPYVFAIRSNVQHGELAANWTMDGNKFAERWWFG